MIHLKAGYYIDEFNKQLENIVGKEILQGFFSNMLFFDITNFPDFLNTEDIQPLLKTSWNIISRGEPTRASISLSENILSENLGENYSGLSSKNPEIEFLFNSDFFSDVEKNLLSEILINFNEFDESQIASTFGSKYLKIFRVLYELIASAQIQRAIILHCLSIGTLGPINFKILGVRKELSETLINDINNLFSSLNALVADDEPQLELLSFSNSIPEVKISYNIFTPNSYNIEAYTSSTENYFCKILTDRRVKYKSLGVVIEQEQEGKYLQRFNYQSPNQEKALNFFLQNIFRKRKFRPGQESIINRAIQGKDVIGLLPTGGGKSLTYQICALLQPGVTIVVDPINSLMKDQYDKLLDNGITKTNFINSFNTKDEREKNIRNLTESRYLILFVSPERFQIEKFRNSLGGCYFNKVYYSYAVIDEAHCVSEWGHDFRHTYLKLAQNLKRFCKPKSNNSLCLFGLTATASFDVLADVQRELEMQEDAIISLPAEAIDRKELNFEILKIEDEISNSLEYWRREHQIGELKYPLIKDVIKSLPQKIEKLEKEYGYFNPSPYFFKKNGSEYLNAGVIFCPTKSNKLKNGVISLYDELQNEDHLSIGTFFGSQDNDTIKDGQIEELAALSVENQEKFIRNEFNLMIATKAFGMGIDKPNIRYSIHYSFPNSVESFYQEAGRAGRDGHPSICSIIYHPKDILTNYDFYRNAFKGIDREIEIIDELLNEVKYEDDFYLGVFKRQVQDRFPEVISMNLNKNNKRYIYLNGPHTNNPDPNTWIKIGLIDLERGLRTYDNATQNFDQNRANEILEYARSILQNECPNGDYLSWLQKKSTDGIKTLIESETQENYSLKIGFTNDTISKMKEIIKGNGYETFDEVIIRAAYNFSSNADDFISNLHYQYAKFTGFSENLNLNTNTEEYLKSNYSKIRNSSDTQRAVYRMSIVGIIDDYVIDYVGSYIEVMFQAKSETEYLENFKAYLNRYLGNQSTEFWLSKVKNSQEDSILKKVLYTLIRFIEEEISDKRKRSIDYMQQLCELGHEQGEKAFRENIIYYFTSKYARVDYLPKDTDGGRIESIGIVKKYLDFISKPPDGLGGEIDNAKHLRGACSNLRITMTKENASIDLLTSYSLFALEAKESDNIENAINRPLVAQAIELYRKGFRSFLKSEEESWEDIKDLLSQFNEKILDINPVVKPMIHMLTNEILLIRTTLRLTQFLNKIS